MNHEAFAGFRTKAWENPCAGSSSVCMCRLKCNEHQSLLNKSYLKLAENVDEDSAVKHWLAVHRRDQVGNFLLGCEIGAYLPFWFFVSTKIALLAVPERWASPTSPLFWHSPASEIIVLQLQDSKPGALTPVSKWDELGWVGGDLHLLALEGEQRLLGVVQRLKLRSRRRIVKHLM